MKLIYTYLKEYNGIEFDFQLNFSTKFNIEFIQNELKINSIESAIPERFFGENIEDINLLVGKNGIGKTTLINFITNRYDSNDFINTEEYSGFNLYKGEKENIFFVDILNLNIKNLFPDGDMQNDIFKFKMEKENYIEVERQSGVIEGTTIGISYEKEKKEKTIKTLFDFDRAMIDVKQMKSVNVKGKLEFIKESYSLFEHKDIKKLVFIKNKEVKESRVTLEMSSLTEEQEASFNMLYEEIIKIRNNQFEKMGISQSSDVPKRFEKLENKYLVISELYLLPAFFYNQNCDTNQMFIITYLKNICLELLTNIKRAKLSTEERVNIYKNILLFANGEDTLKKFPYVNESFFGFSDAYDASCTKMDESLDDSRNYGLNSKEIMYIGYLKQLSVWVNKRGNVKNLKKENSKLVNIVQKIKNFEVDQFIDEFTFQFDIMSEYSFSLKSIIKQLSNKNKKIENRGLVIEIPSFSSGENQLISHFTSIFEFIDNSMSDNIILLIDEPDIYLHPEWVRKYIESLSNYLNVYSTITFQIIITTHSFLLVSDIPKQYIHKLNEKDHVKEVGYGFGSNFYDIIGDSFFLDNSIGEFASNKIRLVSNLFSKCLSNEISPKVKLDELVISCSRDLNSTLDSMPMDLNEALRIVELTINIIDDPLYKNLFFNHLKNLKKRLYMLGKFSDKNSLEDELERHKKIVQELEKKLLNTNKENTDDRVEY